MKTRLKFTKEISGWYAVLPEWDGPKSDLKMVMGADTWLDLLCDGEWDVWLMISDESFKGANELIRIAFGCDVGDEIAESGATYKIENYMGIPYDFKLWLCDVTEFVFGYFPEVIYYQKS
jgi:hypothetical protein